MSASKPAVERDRYRVDEDTLAVLFAWVMVLNRLNTLNVTLFSIWAIDDFRTRECIDCVTCRAAGLRPLPMTVTAAAPPPRMPRPQAHRRP